MAQFRAVISGQRGSASRLGSRKSGIRADVNGWNLGVRVYGGVNEQLGVDEFEVYLTGGSNGTSRAILLGRYTIQNLDALQIAEDARQLADNARRK